MKSIQFFAAIAAFAGMVACCNNKPQQFTGIITDASMNTVTVKALTNDDTKTFSTEDADMSAANGMLLGAPIIVDFKGCAQEVTAATKVSTDPTYYHAVGKWTMVDPIDSTSVMGINLMVKGAAESINMASLPYTSWELQGEENKLILKGQSIGTGETIDFTQTGIMSQNEEGVWSMAIEDTGVVLTKQAE